MKWPIGFNAGLPEDAAHIERCPDAAEKHEPRKSVVRVHFPARNTTLSYYNDRFDLRRGDFVFVDGKLEGLRGRVVDVAYTFKIKLSDYKRVIAVADTCVSGEFFLAGSHFVTFEEGAVPFEKVITWFRPPHKPEEEYAAGYDDTAFDLGHLESMKVHSSVAERGGDYYRDNRVVYVSVHADGTGRAIVEGSEPYVVEFNYAGGMISNLTCTCFCSDSCKHEFAAMLQLSETLDFIAQHYQTQSEKTGYFAAVSKPVFMAYAVDGRETGSFKL